MPSGYAINNRKPSSNAQADREARSAAVPGVDPEDVKLTQVLRARPHENDRPAPSSSPPQKLPQATLLRYLDGSLNDPPTRALVEQVLVEDPLCREQVAIVKAALGEADEAAPAADAALARFVFYWSDGSLRFLRGSCPPEDDGAPQTFSFLHSLPTAQLHLSLTATSPLQASLTLTRGSEVLPMAVEIVGGAATPHSTITTARDGDRLLLRSPAPTAATTWKLRLRSAGESLGTVVLDFRL